MRRPSRIWRGTKVVTLGLVIAVVGFSWVVMATIAFGQGFGDCIGTAKYQGYCKGLADCAVKGTCNAWPASCPPGGSNPGFYCQYYLVTDTKQKGTCWWDIVGTCYQCSWWYCIDGWGYRTVDEFGLCSDAKCPYAWGFFNVCY